MGDELKDGDEEGDEIDYQSDNSSDFGEIRIEDRDRDIENIGTVKSIKVKDDTEDAGFTIESEDEAGSEIWDSSSESSSSDEKSEKSDSEDQEIYLNPGVGGSKNPIPRDLIEE